MKKKLTRSLRELVTEQTNRASAELDRKPASKIVQIINREDARVAEAVKHALPAIARAVDWVVEGMKQGGRLIYVGTGTSGRIAALDAAECPPTFNTGPEMVQFVMAGGTQALAHATEASEDSRRLGQREIAKRRPGPRDVVVGVAASGRTPFTIAALEYASKRGARTVAVTCNRHTELERVADLAIVTEVGPEVVAGSSRMKAGTAQKMVLNMLSTGALTRLGYVYGNLMVNLHLKNTKLRERGIWIVEQVTGKSRRTVAGTLRTTKSVPVAIVMLQAGVSKMTAQRALRRSGRNVREAITSLAKEKH
jgi:N-acetylmuramic acid 6-phosphate etherase